MKTIFLEQQSVDAPLLIIYNCSINTFKKLVKKQTGFTIDDNNDDYDGLHINLPKCGRNKIRRFIWLKTRNKEDLLHEIVHYAYNVIIDKNFYLKQDNSESIAYLVSLTYTAALKKF